MATTEPPSTWGGLLTSYCEERASTGPAMEPQFRFSRKKAGVVKVKERMFNPVTQRHMDGTAEQTARTRERERSVTDINKGMKTALTKGSYLGYDIITQRPRFGIKAIEDFGHSSGFRGKRTDGVRPPDSRVNYDIVTLQGPAPKVQPDTDNTRKHKKFNRQYNIVSHRYASGHDEKCKERDDLVRAHCGKLAEKNYDPIRAIYGDTAREQRELLKTKKLLEEKKTALHTTTSKTPACLQRSEGHNYDILIGHVYSTSEVEKLDKLGRRGVGNRQALRAKANTQVRAADDSVIKMEQRAINRISQQRLVDACRSGHDIVRNTPVALPPVAPSTWDMLEKTAT